MMRSIRSNFLYKLISVKEFSTENYKPVALRSKKEKATTKRNRYFVDVKRVITSGGQGGDGCISFLQLWANETAGPDGADGGSGGHVIFQATENVSDLSRVPKINQGGGGEDGRNKDCIGRNGKHCYVQVPVGTVVRNDKNYIVGDLHKENMMFLAARGGAGGHGNHFFASDNNQSPTVAEFGALGENKIYILEVKSMADIGLIGFPNAGKSTLLRAISRARPKVASYPFTTLQPYLGMIQYTDLEQVTVADLPGLIPGSHKNRGLGIQFLKHAERCAGLLYIIDASCDEPWEQLATLKYELSQFSEELVSRPHAVIGNKIDLEEGARNIETLQEKIDLPLIPISAKTGKNVANLLEIIRDMYDERQALKKTREVNEDEDIT